MTENHIKEELSNNFVRIIAANRGYMLDKPAHDYGVDFMVSKVFTRFDNGKTRYLKDSRYIDIQLKATTEEGVEIDAIHNIIKYDLEAKNFNDLVSRNDSSSIAPLLLILFVLPNSRDNWVAINNQEILLRKCAYWYTPPCGTQLTENSSTIRISIPRVNALDINCFDDLYDKFY